MALVTWEVGGRDSPTGSWAHLIELASDRFSFVVVSRSLAEELRPLVEWRQARAPQRPGRVKWAAFFLTASARLRRLRPDLTHVLAAGPMVLNRVDLVSVGFSPAEYCDVLAREYASSPPIGLRARRLVNAHLESWCYASGRVRALGARSAGAVGDLQDRHPGVRVMLTPPGVDTDRFRPDPLARRHLRQAEGVADDELVSLFVGRDWERKRLPLAIEALALAAAATSAPSGMRLWVVGDGNRPRMERLARERGVESHLRFFGSRSDVVRYYQAADLFLFPTLYETFCRAAHEAAACGLPVIATSVPGVEELVGENEAGVLVDGQAPAISKALIRLAANPALRARLGEAARRRARAHDLERSTELTLRAYDELLGGRPDPERESS